MVGWNDPDELRGCCDRLLAVARIPPPTTTTTPPLLTGSTRTASEICRPAQRASRRRRQLLHPCHATRTTTLSGLPQGVHRRRWPVQGAMNTAVVLLGADWGISQMEMNEGRRPTGRKSRADGFTPPRSNQAPPLRDLLVWTTPMDADLERGCSRGHDVRSLSRSRQGDALHCSAR